MTKLPPITPETIAAGIRQVINKKNAMAKKGGWTRHAPDFNDANDTAMLFSWLQDTPVLNDLYVERLDNLMSDGGGWAVTHYSDKIHKTIVIASDDCFTFTDLREMAQTIYDWIQERDRIENALPKISYRHV